MSSLHLFARRPIPYARFALVASMTTVFLVLFGGVLVGTSMQDIGRALADGFAFAVPGLIAGLALLYLLTRYMPGAVYDRSDLTRVCASYLPYALAGGIGTVAGLGVRTMLPGLNALSWSQNAAVAVVMIFTWLLTGTMTNLSRDQEERTSGHIRELQSQIAERERMAEALRDSEEWLQAVFESVRDGIVVFDTAGRILRVNPRILEVGGYSAEQLVGQPLHVLPMFKPGNLELILDVFSRGMGGEDIGPFEVEVVTEAGVDLTVEVHGCPLTRGGQVVGAVAIMRNASERKRAEEALQESERKYRDLFQNTQVGMVVIDIGTSRVVLVNQAAAAILGFASAEEAIGIDPLELVAEDERDRAIRLAMEGMGSEDQCQFFEFRSMTREGAERWVRAAASHTDYQGKPAALISFVDITGRKRAERLLQESEARYRMLADNATDVIWTMDIGNRRLTYVSPAVARLQGYSPEEAVGHTLEEIMTPASLELARKTIAEELAFEEHAGPEDRDRSHALELEMNRKDGSTVWAEVRITALRDQDGRPTACLGVSRDITERKQTQEELARNSERREALYTIADAMDQSLDMGETLHNVLVTVADVMHADAGFIYLVDLDSGELWSKAHHGVSAELLAAVGSLRLDTEELERVTNWTEPVIDIDRVLSGERAARVKKAIAQEGLRAYVVQPFWHKGVPMGAIAVGSHSERRFGVDGVDLVRAMGNQVAAGVQNAILYEKERALREQLETEAKIRVEFLRAIVHELKTPVTAMIASSDLMTLELREEPWRTAAKNIYRSAERLNRRIDELLDVARGDLGMIKVSCGAVDPLALLHEVCRDMSQVAAERGHVLTLDTPGALPMVWADEDRLRQVLVNLVDNANKYMLEPGTINITARTDDDDLVIEVHDTGPGIGPEEQKRLFDPYYRLVDDRAHFSGLGLGLALCKTLVQLHGGRIWVESEKGKGSTFGFSIPRNR